MFTCTCCLQEFNTEQEVHVHTETCRKNVSQLPMSQLKTFRNIIDNVMIKTESRQVTETQCYYCVKIFNTVKEVVAHWKTCRMLLTRNALEDACTTIRRIWSDQKLTQISLPSTLSTVSRDSTSVQKSDDKQHLNNPGYDLCRAINTAMMPLPAIPSTSKACSLQKPLRKQVLNTDINRNPTTKFNSSQALCVLCYETFQSYDDLGTHYKHCAIFKALFPTVTLN